MLCYYVCFYLYFCKQINVYQYNNTREFFTRPILYLRMFTIVVFFVGVKPFQVLSGFYPFQNYFFCAHWISASLHNFFEKKRFRACWIDVMMYFIQSHHTKLSKGENPDSHWSLYNIVCLFCWCIWFLGNLVILWVTIEHP